MGAFVKQILEYIKNAPVIVQFTAVLCAATIFVILAFGGFIPFLHKDNPATAATPQQSSAPEPYTNVKGAAPVGTYAGGTPAHGVASDAPTIDATLQQDAAHWHLQHSGEDDPDWKYIEGKKGDPSFVKYRYFAHSDHCLYILRQEVGKPPTEKWILNPTASPDEHRASVEPVALPAQQGQPYDVKQAMNRISVSDALKRAIQKSLPEENKVMAAEGTGQMVPNGPQYCINPHPGPFTWYWGPRNGCLQAQYRTFADGCQHYQIFNACTGVWDPQVNWTFCRIH